MKTIIYYFTGTGNSLQVTIELAKKISDATVMRISESINVDISAERVGFVFPVHLWGAPSIVKKFLAKLPANMDTKYLFAIATCKSHPVNVIGQVEKIIKKTQNELSSGFTIEMPGNNIIYYDTEPENIQNKKIDNCLIRLNKIADIINNQQKIIPKTSVVENVFFTGFLHSTLTKTFKGSDKNFWTNNDCTLCGICTKVCPVGNIRIKDEKPIWNHNCQQCVACINSCPNHSIQYGKTTISRKRYINQQVGVKGLLNKQ